MTAFILGVDPGMKGGAPNEREAAGWVRAYLRSAGLPTYGTDADRGARYKRHVAELEAAALGAHEDGAS